MVDVDTPPVRDTVIVPFAVFLDYQARRKPIPRVVTREPALPPAIPLDGLDVEGGRL